MHQPPPHHVPEARGGFYYDSRSPTEPATSGRTDSASLGSYLNYYRLPPSFIYLILLAIEALLRRGLRPGEIAAVFCAITVAAVIVAGELARYHSNALKSAWEDVKRAARFLKKRKWTIVFAFMMGFNVFLIVCVLAERPASGVLYINSVPAGATVWVNGDSVGLTPGWWFTPAGWVAVRLSHPETMHFDTSATIVAHKVTRLDSLKLKRVKVSLMILTEPLGATVWLDGRELGQMSPTEDSVVTGIHQLRIAKSDFVEKDTIVRVVNSLTEVHEVHVVLDSPAVHINYRGQGRWVTPAYRDSLAEELRRRVNVAADSQRWEVAHAILDTLRGVDSAMAATLRTRITRTVSLHGAIHAAISERQWAEAMRLVAQLRLQPIASDEARRLSELVTTLVRFHRDIDSALSQRQWVRAKALVRELSNLRPDQIRDYLDRIRRGEEEDRNAAIANLTGQLDDAVAHRRWGDVDQLMDSLSHFDADTARRYAECVRDAKQAHATELRQRAWDAIDSMNWDRARTYTDTLYRLDSTAHSEFPLLTWNSSPSMRDARRGPAAATIGERLYVVGGYNGYYLRTMEVYDFGTHRWSNGPVMPTVRWACAAASIEGKLYVVGGSDGTHYLPTLDIYDPVTREWTTGPPMRTNRWEPAAAAVGGRLYVVGGSDSSGTPLNTAEMYNPTTGEWRECAVMPTARYGLAAAEVDRRFYVVGGCVRGNSQAVLEIYDPVTNVWSTGPPMSTPRRGLAVAEVCGKLYAVGGFHEGKVLRSVEVFDVRTNRWRFCPPMSEARFDLAVAVFGRALYVIGGYDGVWNLNTIEILEP